MSTKDLLRELAQKLPPDASISEVILALERAREFPSPTPEQILAELHEYQRQREAGLEFDSPAWHEKVLSERVGRMDNTEEKSLTVDEVFAELRRRRK
jgi:hypothetical protein